MFNQFGDLERSALRPGNVHSADGWDGVLKPVVTRYQGKVSRIYFRADAAFAMPGVYEFLEAERIKYAIRLPANQILQHRIGYLLKRPVGRPPNEVRRFYANFTYQAGSWTHPRRVIAKVEWHPGELYPRVGFIVTNMARPATNVVAFYNKRGTCEQWIKEGKGAIKWTRLSCRTFAANAVRLQLHALAYNLGNFLRTLATPEPIKDWSLTSLKEKLIKIGAKVVCHGRYVAFQMAEVAIPRQMFQEILRLIADYGRSHHQRQREARDCHAFTSNRREECVQMPAKIARLATRPLFWIPEVSVAVRSSRPSCSKAEKREYSWQIGSHPGNPG